MRKNKRLLPPASGSSLPRQKEGIRSWLKIQMESEGYQPPARGRHFSAGAGGTAFLCLCGPFLVPPGPPRRGIRPQAQENRLRQERIFAPRGRILDDGDKVLADNRTAYGLSLVREDCRDIPAALAQISAWSGILLPKSARNTSRIASR